MQVFSGSVRALFFHLNLGGSPFYNHFTPPMKVNWAGGKGGGVIKAEYPSLVGKAGSLQRHLTLFLLSNS